MRHRNDRKDEAGMNELTVRSGDVKRKWVFVFPNGQNIGASQWTGCRSETGGKGAVESKWVVVCSTLTLGGSSGDGRGTGLLLLLPLYLHGPCLHEAWRRWDRPSC